MASAALWRKRSIILLGWGAGTETPGITSAAVLTAEWEPLLAENWHSIPLPRCKSIRSKSSVAILVNDYIKLLEIDAKRVFDLLLKQSPLAIYTMLTHDYARRVFLGNEYFKEQLSNNVNSLSARILRQNIC